MTRFVIVKNKSTVYLDKGRVFLDGEDITPLGMYVERFKTINGSYFLFLTEKILILHGFYLGKDL